jgi:antitoxin MazE
MTTDPSCLYISLDIQLLKYIHGGVMQVSKWGNSLAVRLPAAVVDALELKEGDDIEVRVTGKKVFEVSRDRSRERALERLRKLQRPLPAGFVFDRDDIYDR